jgi:hypothetical protein
VTIQTTSATYDELVWLCLVEPARGTTMSAQANLHLDRRKIPDRSRRPQLDRFGVRERSAARSAPRSAAAALRDGHPLPEQLRRELSPWVELPSGRITASANPIREVRERHTGFVRVPVNTRGHRGLWPTTTVPAGSTEQTHDAIIVAIRAFLTAAERDALWFSSIGVATVAR